MQRSDQQSKLNQQHLALSMCFQEYRHAWKYCDAFVLQQIFSFRLSARKGREKIYFKSILPNFRHMLCNLSSVYGRSCDSCSVLLPLSYINITYKGSGIMSQNLSRKRAGENIQQQQQVCEGPTARSTRNLRKSTFKVII